MLAVGDTDILFVVAEVFQLKLVAPDATKAVELPAQIVELFTATVGVVLMVITWLDVFEPNEFLAISETV